MIRSRTVNTIHELAAQGKSVQDIAIELGIARNTVRRSIELCDRTGSKKSSLINFSTGSIFSNTTVVYFRYADHLGQ